MREGYEGGVWVETIDSYARPSVLNASSIYGLPSEACVIIELAVFRGLILFMIDFVSVSVEKSNHTSSQAVSKVFIQIITVYHY